MESTAGPTALGYIGVRSARLDDWGAHATRLLGMQQVDRAGAVRAFRMDDRRQRLIVTADGGEGLGFLGWEVADAAALGALAARLAGHGVAVRHAPRALADARHVADLILFEDPAGNRLEAFHGPAVASDPFRPGRPVSGFRTGPLGMGHAVLNVADVEPLLPFYRDLPGFRVSDYGLKPLSAVLLPHQRPPPQLRHGNILTWVATEGPGSGWVFPVFLCLPICGVTLAAHVPRNGLGCLEAALMTGPTEPD